MELKGSKTEKNLLAAFAGESQARNRYTLFAKAAQKEGYQQIGALFLETADNEHQHARVFFEFLQGGMVEITASYPAGVVGTTLENLKAAASGEHEEWETLYPGAANIAREEGFKQVAAAFDMIAKVEVKHEERYLKLAANIGNSEVFKKQTQTAWICRKCGHVHLSTDAPNICPLCKHPQAHFEMKAENY